MGAYIHTRSLLMKWGEHTVIMLRSDFLVHIITGKYIKLGQIKIFKHVERVGLFSAI